MFNFTTFARKALLAVALVIGSGAALAGPVYQVTIHTQAYSGESGLLDFSLGNYGGSPLAIAQMWNFSGAFSDEFDRTSNVSGDLAGGIAMDNTRASNYWTQGVILGDDFSFNLRFSGDYETADSAWDTLFAVVLYDASLTQMWAIPAQIDLVPAFNGAPLAELVQADADTDISVVPEPSQLLLVLSALALAGLALRRSRKA
jgi:hypothetical protein